LPRPNSGGPEKGKTPHQGLRLQVLWGQVEYLQAGSTAKTSFRAHRLTKAQAATPFFVAIQAGRERGRADPVNT